MHLRPLSRVETTRRLTPVLLIKAHLSALMVAIDAEIEAAGVLKTSLDSSNHLLFLFGLFMIHPV